MSDNEEIKSLIKSNERLIEQNELLFQEVKGLKETCSRMDNHISFVEKTYNILIHPMNWFINTWYNVYGYLRFSKVDSLEYHESKSE